MFYWVPVKPALSKPARDAMAKSSSQQRDSPQSHKDASEMAQLLVKSLADCPKSGTVKIAVKNDWVDLATQLHDYLSSLCSQRQPSLQNRGDETFSFPPESLPLDLPWVQAIVDALGKVQSELSAIRQENVEMKKEISLLRESHNVCSIVPSQVANVAEPSPSISTSAQAATTPKVIATTFAEVTAKQTKWITVGKKPRNQAMTVPTIRVRAASPSTNLGHELDSIILPDGVSLVNSKEMADGSKVLYCRQASQLEQLLASNDKVTVVEKPKFKPRVKVLNADKDTEKEIVQAALQVTKSRHLCTIKAKNPAKCHFIFEVEPEEMEGLLNRRALLPGWNACRIVECNDAPQCIRCVRPGHNAQNCTHLRPCDPSICAKCGKAGHLANACTAAVPCCANCKRRKRTDTAHSAFSRACPVLQQYVQWRLTNTQHA